MSAAGGAGAASAAPKPNHEYVGSGTYGAVIKPALPNINSDGSLIEYPGNITKLFFKKHNKNFAIEGSKTMLKKVGNEAHRVHDYTRKYKLNNIRPYVSENTLKRFEFNANNENKYVSMLRMPYLGVNLDETSKPEIYNKLRKVPFVNILKEIRKLFYQLKLLSDATYIHGDVRSVNILIDPETGKMSLIDFDWLSPQIEFWDYYIKNHVLYSNPPESLIINYGLNVLPVKLVQFIRETDTDEIIKLIKEKKLPNKPAKKTSNNDETDKAPKKEEINPINAYIHHSLHAWCEAIPGMETSAEEMEKALEAALRKTIEHFKEDFISMYLKFLEMFDSYGLACSVLCMLHTVYGITPEIVANKEKHLEFLSFRIKNSGDIETLRQALEDLYTLLKLIVDFELFKRPTYDDILRTLDELISRFPSKGEHDAAQEGVSHNTKNGDVGGGGGGGGGGDEFPNSGGARVPRRRTRGRRNKTRRPRRSRRTARK